MGEKSKLVQKLISFVNVPTATTAICYAHAEAMRRSLNSDHLKWSVDISK